jgi:hypothetical protein
VRSTSPRLDSGCRTLFRGDFHFPSFDCAWIRALHADDGRLPAMILAACVHKPVDVRVLELESIMKHLAEGMPLLNREEVLLGP